MKLFLTAAAAALFTLAPLCGKAQTQKQESFGNIPITKGTSPKFIWTNWTKAPQVLKDATNLIITRRGSTLYDFIQSVLTEEDVAYPEVDIALIDLNGDGVLGIGIQLRSRSWCGTAGCAYEMYDNAGIIYVIVSDHDLKPAVNGVESSAKKYFVMEANKKCQYHGINDTPAIFITKEI